MCAIAIYLLEKYNGIRGNYRAINHMKCTTGECMYL